MLFIHLSCVFCVSLVQKFSEYSISIMKKNLVLLIICLHTQLKVITLKLK